MPLPGDAMPMRDVTVEQFDNGRAVVISRSAHPPDADLVIHIPTRAGLSSQRVRVVSSSPVSRGGALFFRIELRSRRIRQTPARSAVTRSAASDPPSRTAVLGRPEHVDVDDVSRSGCRLTGPTLLNVGEVGVLTVTIDGETHVELFRVSRCAEVRASRPLFHSGVEFLPMPAVTRSLHDLAARLDESHST
jgi:hypothetical protein